MLRQSTHENRKTRSIPERAGITGPIRVIFETDPDPEVQFVEYGIRAAMAKSFGVDAEFESTGYGTLSKDFQENLEAFIERAADKARTMTDDWCVYCTASTIPFKRDGEPEPIPFVISVALRPGRPVGVSFEPLDEDLSEAADTCLRSVANSLSWTNPILERSRRERECAEALMESAFYGINEGYLLQVAKVSPAFPGGN